MKKYFHTTNSAFIIILGLALFLFYPGMSLYFHQDDFIHMTYSDTLSKVIHSFNIFAKGDFPFYRPIPTQVYFFTMHLLFGLNPLGYHIVNFILFSINCILVYRVASTLFRTSTTGILATLFYGINATHIAPLYAPAYCHELFYVLFGTACVYFFLERKIKLSILFFIFALMSKETAIVLPGIIGISYIFWSKKRTFLGFLKIMLPYASIVGIYLIAHIVWYGLAKGPSYTIILGKPTINILIWYVLWALSVPNILIDFIGPAIHMNYVFFQVAGEHASILFFSLFGFLLSLLIMVCNLVVTAKRDQFLIKALYSVCWFVLGMIPLIIFPLHKLATEQAFSLVGVSLILGWIFTQIFHSKKAIRYIGFVSMLMYLIHAANTISMAPKTHWIALSARQAKLTTDYLLTQYPTLTQDSILYFKNGEIKIPQYGSAKQIYQALGNDAAIEIMYPNQHIHSYFDDIKPLPPGFRNDPHLIVLDASKFLGY